MLKINFLLFTFPILNTLKENNLAGSKCRYNRKIFFATFKQKVTVIKCQENSKIKMSREFKVTNCWNGKKPVLKWNYLNKNLAIYYHNSEKDPICTQKWGMKSAKKGYCHTL